MDEDDQIEAIRSRTEKRNLELQQLLAAESKENNTNVTTTSTCRTPEKKAPQSADNGKKLAPPNVPNKKNKVSQLIRSFNAAAEVERERAAAASTPATLSPARSSRMGTPSAGSDMNISILRHTFSSSTGREAKASNDDDIPSLASFAGTVAGKVGQLGKTPASPSMAHRFVSPKLSQHRPQPSLPFQKAAPAPPMTPSQVSVSVSSPSKRSASPSVTIETMDNNSSCPSRSESPTGTQQQQQDVAMSSCSSSSANSVIGIGTSHGPTSASRPGAVDEHDQHQQHNYRPITPNDQIIGSLWEDINVELEKLKQSRLDSQQFDDPNLSPRTRFGIKPDAMVHSISSYRQGVVGAVHGVGSGFKRGVEDVERAGAAGGGLSASSEKRQRSEEDNTEAGAEGKDAPDSLSTTMTSSTEVQDAYMKRLHEMIIVQQDQICQASRALAFCRQNEHFRGGKEEIDAQRALLISTERRRALLLERDRLIKGRHPAPAGGLEPKGTLAFSSISLRLIREYITSYTQHTAPTYNFIVLIKCADQVFHTSLKSSNECVRSGYVEFQHYIPLSGLTPDFVCDLEVYSLKASREANTADTGGGRSKKGTWRRMVISTPLNAYTNSFTSYSTGANAHRPMGVMDPGFQRVGHLSITRQLIGRQKFLLNDAVYPLDGSCLLNMDCRPDQQQQGQEEGEGGGEAGQQLFEHRSFLSLYQIVSGLGSWTRFWCVLGGGQMRFWRYPEDEAMKQSTAHLELAWCVTAAVPVPESAASFPNSIQLDVWLPSKVEGAEKECVRMLFAADTPDERDFWLQAINQAIKNSTIWRSMRRKQQPDQLEMAQQQK